MHMHMDMNNMSVHMHMSHAHENIGQEHFKHAHENCAPNMNSCPAYACTCPCEVVSAARKTFPGARI